MRPVLIRLLFEEPWRLFAPDVEGVPGIGAAAALCGVAVAYAIWVTLRPSKKWSGEDTANAVVWGIVVVAVTAIGPTLPVDSLPVFGYGFMVLCGFLSAILLGKRLAVRGGIDPNLIFDAAFSILICGVIGGRLFYCIQHGDRVFREAKNLKDFFIAAINLSNGGLVLIGAMLGGGVGFYLFTRRREFDKFRFLDAITPPIFLAIMFGRIGCLLYGCCFGDPSTLPWAVTFPEGSPPYETYVHRGLLSAEATACTPLHPTQVYSSINALLLCLVTLSYLRRRTHIGSVFALGLILYPMTRFLIEYLRSDELGQFGTTLTISQWLSIGLFTAGCGLAAWLNRGKRVEFGSEPRAKPIG